MPFSKIGCGSSFPVRYVFGGLLFLKPLGTFLNMLPEAFSVNSFPGILRPFPQVLSAAFRWSYGLVAVDSLCIKQDRRSL
jgi:hypothetical protein